jgi:hypothetical protein
MPDPKEVDADPVASPSLALLEYASPPPVRGPWGPLLFKPSRRSLVLLALLILAAGWLALRHDPWRRVGTLPGDLVAPPTFTRDGLILTLGAESGANLYDPGTARRVRTVLPRIDADTRGYFVLDRGERILALSFTGRIADVYDVRSGRLVERLPNPDGLGSELLLVAPDAPRLMIRRTAGRPTTQATTRPLVPAPIDATYWDLTHTPPTSRPVELWGAEPNPQFSPDGSRVLQLDRHRDALKLLDGHTLGTIREEKLPEGGPLMASGFAGTESFWLLRAATQVPVWYDLAFRSVRTGRVRSSTLISVGTPGSESSSAASDDGRMFALVVDSRAGMTSQASSVLHVYEAATGAEVLTRDASARWEVRFFPGSQRLLAGDGATGRLAVFDPPRAQPLALLPGPPPTSQYIPSTVQISPDGRTILTAPALAFRGDPKGHPLDVYRPAGWDCPESTLGAVVFPQTWLTAVLGVALGLSLLADARGARHSAARRVSPWLIAGLVSIALPLTAHALVATCLGRWVRTPAPLLLITAIGLATHARAWRAIALPLLCGLLPLLAYEAHALRTLGLLARMAYPLLDRYHDIPHRLPFGAVVGLAVLTVAGIYLLIRPRAEL